MGKLDLTALAQAMVLGEDGRRQSMGEVFEAHPGPLVVVWLRHFG